MFFGQAGLETGGGRGVTLAPGRTKLLLRFGAWESDAAVARDGGSVSPARDSKKA
jgi:hypothetical protein